MSKFFFFLDSGAFTIWKKDRLDVETQRLLSRVKDAIKQTGSKVAAAKLLGIPYGRVLYLTSTSHKTKITLPGYAEFVIKNRRTFRAGAFNLDEIGSGEVSYRNWCELRSLGADVIPIFHIGSDESYLKKYLDNSDYIGLGAIAKMRTNDRLHSLDRVWKEYLTNPDGSAKVRVHGLGLTSNGIVTRYPWYSVDSSMIASIAINGGAILPAIKKGGWDYSTFSVYSVSNQTIYKMSKLPGGSYDGYYNLPVRSQRIYKDLIESFGLSVDDSLNGQVLNPLVASKKSKRPSEQNRLPIEFGALDSYEDDDEGCLNITRTWKARLGLNCYVIEAFLNYQKENGNPVKWYNVAVSGVLDQFAAIPIDSLRRILVSYAYLIGSKKDRSTAFLDKVKQYASQ